MGNILLKLINVYANIVKPAVFKEGLILFNDMEGNASALTGKKSEARDLSIRHGISLTLEVITVE